MGVSKVFTTPKSIPKLFEYLELFNLAPKWKDIKPEESPVDEKETKLMDAQCTRIKMSDFLGGNVSIFNLYIRLGVNRYVKILNRGETFNDSRLEKYRLEGIEYLYFQTKERANYINFMNEMGRKMSCTPEKQAANSVFVCINSVTEQYLDEVFTAGIQPQIIHEGKSICDNIFNLIRNDTSLNQIIEEYKKINPESFSHIFLVAFFSTVICKNLDWVGEKTRDAVALGSLLHDIGMMKLPVEIRETDPEEMNSKQFEMYQQHPRLGNEMLQKTTMVSEQVRQIVFQHHELVSGNGFPYTLTGIKIYPPAKIVSLADHFATVLKKGNHTPLEGLKIMLQDRNRIMDFDPYIIRSLIKGFIKR
jgi:putative nucleotidyltransferase with HDIG domain